MTMCDIVKFPVEGAKAPSPSPDPDKGLLELEELYTQTERWIDEGMFTTETASDAALTCALGWRRKIAKRPAFTQAGMAVKVRMVLSEWNGNMPDYTLAALESLLGDLEGADGDGA